MGWTVSGRNDGDGVGVGVTVGLGDGSGVNVGVTVGLGATVGLDVAVAVGFTVGAAGPAGGKAELELPPPPQPTANNAVATSAVNEMVLRIIAFSSLSGRSLPVRRPGSNTSS